MVTFNNVSKSYRKNSLVLKNISFQIKKGKTYVLLGNNGSGKSTIINLLCNLLKYESGEIIVFNKKLKENDKDYKKRMGFILSETFFIEDFTVTEYLSFVARLQNVNSVEIAHRINDIMAMLDFEKYARSRIYTLSSGTRMKVALGSSLIHNPEILVLDEPLVNLDIKSQQTLLKILLELKTKKTIFIASHNLELMTDLGDRFLLLENGEIIAELNNEKFKSKDDLYNEIKKYLSSISDEPYNLDWLV
jgi:ABC-2 type transport system ATP-binding protein